MDMSCKIFKQSIHSRLCFHVNIFTKIFFMKFYCFLLLYVKRKRLFTKYFTEKVQLKCFQNSQREVTLSSTAVMSCEKEVNWFLYLDKMFSGIRLHFRFQIVRQMQKSEVGHRGSKLVKVEIRISIDFIKILEAKSGVSKR